MKKTKKKLIIMLFVTVVIIIIGFLCFLKLKKYNTNKLIEDIKSHYSTNVLVKESSEIYINENNEYKSIGKVKKQILLELNNIDEFNTDTKFFKIKDTNYYLYYKDCTKSTDSIIEDILPSYYLPFNQNVLTHNNIQLYLNEEEVFKINDSIDLPLLYQDDNYYYVKYLNKIYGIKKDSADVKDNLNNEENDSEYISIIHYQNITSDECNNQDCVTLKTIENQLKILSENNNYSIDQDDYIKWIKGYIRLKEKAILIVVDDDSLIKDLFEQYDYQYIKEQNLDVKLNDNNKTTNVNDDVEDLSSYLINENNSDEIIDKLLNGEDYVYKIKIVETVINNDSNNYNDSSNDNGNATSIAVLNYHFFYDSTKGETCNESICLEASKFEEQLKYLTDNGYKTLTIDEFKSWMYGEIELPKKSVLLTIDDGAKGTGLHNGNILIPLLEKYQVNATLFLISGWWSPDNYRSEYLDIQSHTYDMHREGICDTESRGSQLLCSTYEEIMEDLTNSLNGVDSNTSFCFPFYVYNDKALQAIKDKGFQIAFVGGGYKATRSSNKYLIPRYPIHSDITLNQFISYIN